MPDERSALIVDDPETRLGEVSLRLLRLGIDVFYTKDLDEAQLLARQEAPRIGAVVFPPDLDAAALAGLARRIGASRRGVAPTLLVVGEEPDAERKAALRASGIERALFEPYDESTLRFVVNAAVHGGSEGDPRRETRVPVTLRGRVYMGLRRKDVLVSTLSAAGAYLETPHPDEPGSQLRIELDLPGDGGPLFAKARVEYVPDPNARRGLPMGMGVVFQPLAGPDEARLRAFIHEQAQRFVV
jgi:hypothetical protein